MVKQQLSLYAGDLIDFFNKNGLKARDENLLQDLLTEDIILYIVNILYLIVDKKAVDQKIEVVNFLGKLNTEFEDNQLLILERNLNGIIVNLRKTIKLNKSVDFVRIIQRIIDFANIERIKTIYPNYRNPKYVEDLLAQLTIELTRNYQETNSLKDALDIFFGKDSIPVMTIHKSKGLEYHSIVFIGLEDGAFWSFEKQPDEDKCAFFVALSRAKERVVFTFSKTRKTKWGLRSTSFKKIQVFFDELQNSKLVKMEVIKED